MPIGNPPEKKRMLDIIVPHHKEPWNVVRPFFDVLSAQKSIDFNDFHVWLINDAGVTFPNYLFDRMPVNVTRIISNKKGVSASRNYGIEHADSKWITFCDCDDCFSSIYSLKFIFSILGTEDYDMMWGPFYTNMLDKQNTLVLQEEFNAVWVHNKYYRLDFLREHDIRFCESLRMSEDSAFNMVFVMEAKRNRIGMINASIPLYSWCRRPDSVTTDPKLRLKNAEGHFDRNIYVLEEYRKRKRTGVNIILARTVTDAYAMLNAWGDPDSKEVRNIEKKFSAFYRENEKSIRRIPEDIWKKGLETSDREVTGGNPGIALNRPSLDEWIEKRVKIYYGGKPI